jgi:ABC-2 type transport system ATP-binding protein
MAEVPPMVVLRDLTRRFGPITAVDGVNLAIPRGELFGLVGPDGGGKTTTLRMLAGILPPTSGEAFVAGRSVRTDAEAVKSRIAYMAQRFGLYRDLSVVENLHFYADLFDVPARARSERIERLLAFSALTPFQHRLAGQLSGGMKQKLGLACALVHQPDVLLLDEPTNGVDPVSRRDFWRILYEMLTEGATILVTTAYLDEAERCNRVGLMHRGRLLAVDAPDRLRASLPGDLVELVVDDPWRARRRLTTVPEALRVTLVGRRLHVAVADGARDLPSVVAALDAEGLRPREARRITPSLEDVFIAMMETPGAEPGRERNG